MYTHNMRHVYKILRCTTLVKVQWFICLDISLWISGGVQISVLFSFLCCWEEFPSVSHSSRDHYTVMCPFFHINHNHKVSLLKKSVTLLHSSLHCFNGIPDLFILSLRFSKESTSATFLRFIFGVYGTFFPKSPWVIYYWASKLKNP